MPQDINIGLPKKKNITKLCLLFMFLVLGFSPGLYDYFQSGRFMYLSFPLIVGPVIAYNVYKSWKNEYKHSRIRTDGKTLYLRRGMLLEQHPFDKITEWEIKKYFGLNLMTLRINQQKSWYFINGFLSSELEALKEFINKFNERELKS